MMKFGAARLSPIRGANMAGLTAPPLGTYTVIPPTADEINRYLRLMRSYRNVDAKVGAADDFTPPSLYATINRGRSRIGVVQNDNDMLLLCSYVLPPVGEDDERLGRLYFALIGERTNPESRSPAIVTWDTHPGLLVTTTDGDANVLTPLALAKTLVQLLGG